MITRCLILGFATMFNTKGLEANGYELVSVDHHDDKTQKTFRKGKIVVHLTHNEPSKQALLEFGKVLYQMVTHTGDWLGRSEVGKHGISG